MIKKYCVYRKHFGLAFEEKFWTVFYLVLVMQGLSMAILILLLYFQSLRKLSNDNWKFLAKVIIKNPILVNDKTMYKSQ